MRYVIALLVVAGCAGQQMNRDSADQARRDQEIIDAGPPWWVTERQLAGKILTTCRILLTGRASEDHGLWLDECTAEAIRHAAAFAIRSGSPTFGIAEVPPLVVESMAGVDFAVSVHYFDLSPRGYVAADVVGQFGPPAGPERENAARAAISTWEARQRRFAANEDAQRRQALAAEQSRAEWAAALQGMAAVQQASAPPMALPIIPAHRVAPLPAKSVRCESDRITPNVTTCREQSY